MKLKAEQARSENIPFASEIYLAGNHRLVLFGTDGLGHYGNSSAARQIKFQVQSSGSRNILFNDREC